MSPAPGSESVSEEFFFVEHEDVPDVPDVTADTLRGFDSIEAATQAYQNSQSHAELLGVLLKSGDAYVEALKEEVARLQSGWRASEDDNKSLRAQNTALKTQVTALDSQPGSESSKSSPLGGGGRWVYMH